MPVKGKNPPTGEKKHQRKQEILTHPSPSVTRQISDALVIKEGNPFFICQPDGDVPIQKGHAFGLYYQDCRFLSGYEVRLANHKPTVLVSNADRDYMAVLEVTNPLLKIDGNKIEKDSIGIHWNRELDGGRRLLKDTFRFQNYGDNKVRLPVSFAFEADFQDIFIIRKLLKKKLGDVHPPQWDQGCLRFVYDGTDGVIRTVKIDFSPMPDQTTENQAQFNIDLDAGQSSELSVCVLVAEAHSAEQAKQETDAQSDIHGKKIDMEPAFSEWRNTHAHAESDSLLLNNIITRASSDLRMLRTSIKNEEFFAAGIPWFATLFGRDSLITSIQTLAFNADLAAETLRVLARYQGKQVNDWKDEQPGKILHELRIGELANTGSIPHTPYYGSFDATPLFLILLGLYCRWTGDLGLLNELKDNVDAAIDWISKYGDLDGDGYLEYDSSSEKGRVVNQGWKDSGNAIVNQRGRIANPPITLVEIQAYVYFAKTLLADLFARNGDASKGEKLKQEARDLQDRFNRDFWSESIGTYVLALEKDNEPAAVVSSNAGHALWAQIATQEKAKRTVDRLMQKDMYSGWGIRTLSRNEARYNPVGYHLGTVWPHDNSIIAAGFKSYGFDQQAHSIVSGILETSMHFGSYRLPEVFAGFSRDNFGVPVHYPVACHPQAWAAGSVLYMMTTLLGLEPNAFERSLRIVRPMLPMFADKLTLRNLRVADASVDLHFQRQKEDEAYAKAEVINVNGKLDVRIEAPN